VPPRSNAKPLVAAVARDSLLFVGEDFRLTDIKAAR